MEFHRLKKFSNQICDNLFIYRNLVSSLQGDIAAAMPHFMSERDEISEDDNVATVSSLNLVLIRSTGLLYLVFRRHKDIIKMYFVSPKVRRDSPKRLILSWTHTCPR